MDPHRRRLLRDLALGTTAFGLFGCVETSKGLPDAGGPTDAGGDAGGALYPEDAAVHVTEYAMEDAAIYAYEAAAPLLVDDAVLQAALMFRDHHRAHQDAAAEALVRLGVPLPELPETYELPALADQTAVLRYALTLEIQAVNAYLGVISQLRDPERRRVSASILASETAHVVVLRTVLGHPSPAGFAFATEVLAPAKDPALGGG